MYLPLSPVLSSCPPFLTFFLPLIDGPRYDCPPWVWRTEVHGLGAAKGAGAPEEVP